MNPLNWERKMWAAIAVIFLIVWKVGESLIAYFQPLPWLSWQIVVLAFFFVFLWLLVKNFDQFQKIYKDPVVEGAWNLILAVSYWGGFYLAVQYIADPSSEIISEFLNQPLSREWRFALAVVMVSGILFVFQPTLNQVFGSHKLFAWATARLFIITVAVVSLFANFGGTYDFKTGVSKIYIDPATGDYYFDKGKSPKTGNELLSCSGVAGDMKVKCAEAQKDYERMENATQSVKKRFWTWLEDVKPSSGGSSATTPAPWNPAKGRRQEANPECTRVQREDGIISGNQAMRSMFVENRCKEFFFEQHTYKAVVRFGGNPCSVGEKLLFQEVSGTPQLWGKAAHPIQGWLNLDGKGTEVTDWREGVWVQKAVYSPFTAITKVSCVS